MNAAERREAGPLRRAIGQITVELLLILPVFLLIVFMIMEIGHLAFQTIIVNHVAYECARIGSLWAGADLPQEASHGSPAMKLGRARIKITDQLRRMIPKATSRVTVEQTRSDPQSGQQNSDIVVTVSYRARLIFPMTPWVLRLSRNCRGGTGECLVTATVRMPIENPQGRASP